MRPGSILLPNLFALDLMDGSDQVRAALFTTTHIRELKVVSIRKIMGDSFHPVPSLLSKLAAANPIVTSFKTHLGQQYNLSEAEVNPNRLLPTLRCFRSLKTLPTPAWEVSCDFDSIPHTSVAISNLEDPGKRCRSYHRHYTVSYCRHYDLREWISLLTTSFLCYGCASARRIAIRV